MIIGLNNAGKTTIIRRFNGEPIDTIAPTLGLASKPCSTSSTLNIWDIGGQQAIRTYWRNAEVTDGLVWVVDSADRWRLDTCEMSSKICLGGTWRASLIAANKQDGPMLYVDRIAEH